VNQASDGTLPAINADMMRDIRQAFRQLFKSPGFTLFAVLTLGLGVGANTAIFSILNAVLIKSLPVKDPNRLVLLTDPTAVGGMRGGGFGPEVRDILTYPEYRYMRDHNDVFDGLLAAYATSFEVTIENGGAVRVQDRVSGDFVSDNYFSVLGVDAKLGRLFGPEENKIHGGSPVAVISYDYWMGRFGGDPGILGRKLRMGTGEFDIIGVARSGFNGETGGMASQIWIPLGMQEIAKPMGFDLFSEKAGVQAETRWLGTIGRLKRGLGIGQAEIGVNVAYQQYVHSRADEVAANARKSFLRLHLELTPGNRGDSFLGRRLAAPLTILMGFVGLLLLIAGANLASLLLARSTFRQKEMGIRLALGARPIVIFRQLLFESILLSAIGGAAGLLFAQWGNDALLGLLSHLMPIAIDASPDARVLVFTLTVSILAGIGFGTAPALRAARMDLNDALKNAATEAGKLRRFSAVKLIVATQVALSCILLSLAGLFLHSFEKLAAVNLGFDRDHLLTALIRPPNSSQKSAAFAQVLQSLTDRVHAIPGVRSAAICQNGFFAGSDESETISIDGYVPAPGRQMDVHIDYVGSDYFSTVGIPILQGRGITLRDAGEGARVGVINQTMARYYFGDENPIGRRITFNHQYSLIVAGVAADAKYNNVRERTPRLCYQSIYDPLASLNFGRIEISAVGDPATLANEVRSVLTEAVPNLPVVQVDTQADLTQRSLGIDQMLAKLTSAIGLLVTVLAAIGIYGVISYGVSRRAREVGIRMALGAQRGSVLWLVLKESLSMVFVGTVVGIPAAIGVGRLIASTLFGLTPADPPVVAIVTATLFIVAALAAYVPARRATRIDPMLALRVE
jgi:predicted permease